MMENAEHMNIVEDMSEVWDTIIKPVSEVRLIS